MADVEAEVERGRMRLTLNRPEKRNALSYEVQRLLNEALWDADNDRNVHSVILRGAGQDFCAGYDLAGAAPRDRDRNLRGASSIDDDIWQLERQQRFRMAIFDMHKPVIAQLHGRCLAGGTDIAFLSDMVIAADDAVIAFPPARVLCPIRCGSTIAAHNGPSACCSLGTASRAKKPK